jgi:glycosyltransferase involved in cell wall biosynthesis
MYLPDQVIAVSKVMQSVIRERLNLPPERVAAVYTGIDIGNFDRRPQARMASRYSLGLAKDDFALIYTGRLVSGKGLEYLMEAVRQAAAVERRVRLIVVGEGPLEVQLRELVLNAGLAQLVVFTGFRLDIPDLLAAADAFVLPSLNEGLPQSMMEAMAAGRAVIATSVGGVPELIEHEVTGLLVPICDPQALAGAIIRLIENPMLCEMLETNAHAVAHSHFGVEHMIECYNTLYQAHLERKNA